MASDSKRLDSCHSVSARDTTAVIAGATTTLTFTLTNPAVNTVALTGVGFTDILPGGLGIATASAALTAVAPPLIPTMSAWALALLAALLLSTTFGYLRKHQG